MPTDAFLIATTIHLSHLHLRPTNPHNFTTHPVLLPDGTRIAPAAAPPPHPHPRYAVRELDAAGQLFELAVWTHAGGRCVRRSRVLRLRFRGALRRMCELVVVGEGREGGVPVWEYLMGWVGGAEGWDKVVVVGEAGRCGGVGGGEAVD
ncbi:hypothetical protein NpNSSI1_00000940 [Neofusicoccum parvum]|nr:hypothetical protein NpNSSI1_00000940 [Neofusicoccum parvum]